MALWSFHSNGSLCLLVDVIIPKCSLPTGTLSLPVDSLGFFACRLGVSCSDDLRLCEARVFMHHHRDAESGLAFFSLLCNCVILPSRRSETPQA